jgi:leader peptidase (prepilin peptidase)/N-methyltransferase
MILQSSHALYAAATALAVPFSFGAVWMSQRLPQHMDRMWRKDCVEFLETPAFVASMPGRGERCVVALCAAVVGAASINHFGAGWTAVLGTLFCWWLLTLAVIDARSMLLPDSLTLPAVWAGLLFVVARQSGAFGSSPPGWPLSVDDALIGAAAGYGALYAIGTVFRLVTGREGIGGGDLKLLAALGAWMGWAVLPEVALIASCSGVVTAIALRIAGRKGVLPFGPHLALAGIVCLFAGQGVVIGWLLTLLGAG